MNLRNLIGSISAVIMVTDFFKIGQLRFPYPYVPEAKRDSQTLANTLYKPGTWFLIVRDRFNLFSSFQQPSKDDLVLVEDFDGRLHFKIVTASSRTYSQFQNGTSYYVPTGFTFLVDPQTKTAGLEPLGSVKFFRYFSLGKWTNIQQPDPVQMKIIPQIENQKSLEAQILQKNNFLQQIQQLKRMQSDRKGNVQHEQHSKYHDFSEDYDTQK